MDFSSICRTCLDTKYLSPIFKEGDDHDCFASTVLITTGLKVQKNDGLPQQMCKTCIKFLKDSLKFRQLCKDAEIQLLTVKNSQENQENNLKCIKLQKRNRRKKNSKDIKSVDTFINVKIEPDVENDDDVPLLRKKLHFTKVVTEHKNVKIETELIKIDEIEQESDSECVKNENNQGIDIEFIDSIRNTENEQEIAIEIINNGNNKHGKEVDNQFANDRKIYENEPKIHHDFDSNVKSNIEALESETNVSDESKYETEFLDLHFDTDTDEHVTKDMEITEYNIEIPNYNKEFPKYSSEIPNKTEIPEHNLELTNYNTENSNYNLESADENTGSQIKLNNIKTGKNKMKQDFKTKNKQNSTKNMATETENIATKEYSTDAETMPHINNIDLKETHRNSENLLFVTHDDRNRVTCKLCQKDLSKRSIFSHMLRSHPGADDRKEKCELCDTYVLKGRLQRHKIVMHGLDSFRCGYCKTEYESKEQLLDHASTCTAKNRKRKAVTDKRKEVIVECDVCNKSMQKASLRLHKEIKHAGMGPVCEHCGRRFGNKYRLNEHLRAKHGHEKYKCSMCDFLSASSTAIRNHERRHRGEKPYVCEQCGAKFHAPHLLAQHKQSHRTEKNMKCDQCPAAFKANNTLHMHKITCHNTNTYQCPMCPRTYSARHYAVKHLRAVHRHAGAVGALLVGPKEPQPTDQKSPT